MRFYLKLVKLMEGQWSYSYKRSINKLWRSLFLIFFQMLKFTINAGTFLTWNSYLDLDLRIEILKKRMFMLTRASIASRIRKVCFFFGTIVKIIDWRIFFWTWWTLRCFGWFFGWFFELTLFCCFNLVILCLTSA